MEFPFVFGKVVTGPQFINRKKELAKLKANIDHGIHTVLISPRRWGKSSLIKFLSKKMSKDKQFKFVLIDFFRFSDEQEFYEEYSKAILKAGSSKLSDLGNQIIRMEKKSFLLVTTRLVENLGKEQQKELLFLLRQGLDSVKRREK